MAVTTKTCSRCRQAKPLDDFKTDQRKPDGKASACKACVAVPRVGEMAGGNQLATLVPYDHARIMLAEAKAVDDVKDILDKAMAMKEYARRAADRTLEIDATEIRFYAERRLGEMIAVQKETVGLNRGRAGAGRPALGAAETEAPKIDPRPTLADVGIDHKLSSHAQKMAAVPAEQFQQRVNAWRDEMAAGQSRVTMDLLKIGEAEQQRQARHDLAQTLSDTSAELNGTRQFPCIYADPAVRRKGGIGDRAYENHYPTMSWDDIMALPVKERLLPDAWGFIWLPRAHVLALHPVRYDFWTDAGQQHQATIETPLAWAIARAWGFDAFSTLAVWDKTDPAHPDEHGTGLVFWDQCEILCLFKKGRGLPMPQPAQKFGSLIRERARGHSEKPAKVRDMIASMTGGLPVLELFARDDPDHPLPAGWEGWGNEAPANEAAA
jgi:N6-adenosine-specific RNA methylase IME4